MTAQEIIRLLELEPHPGEGGFFRETYRSEEYFPDHALPGRYSGARRYSTSIYYLITDTSCSALHRLKSDEVFHFYLGDPVEMLLLKPDGTGEVVSIGSDIASGMRPQVVVPRGIWQGSMLKPGGSFALLGTTVSPGFDYEDFELGSRKQLLQKYPDFTERIKLLTSDTP